MKLLVGTVSISFDVLNPKHKQLLIGKSRSKSTGENPWRKVTLLKSLFSMVVLLEISYMIDEKVWRTSGRGFVYYKSAEIFIFIFLSFCTKLYTDAVKPISLITGESKEFCWNVIFISAAESWSTSSINALQWRLIRSTCVNRNLVLVLETLDVDS